jgi:hypothetical protein
MLQLSTVTKSKRRTIKLAPHTSADPDHWVWPLPALIGAKPGVVSHADDDRLAVDVG